MSTAGALTSPRNLLKIVAVISALRCFTLLVITMSPHPGAPRWINATMLAASAATAVLLWWFASARRPRPALMWTALAAVLVRSLAGPVSLVVSPGGIDPAVMALSVLFGAAVLVFVYVTARKVLREPVYIVVKLPDELPGS